ncbi:MAG: protein translocase subunit SecD [Clostridiales bacterium]|nr:protein translocase subunit SecD [Clostridiales bacterium]
MKTGKAAAVLVVLVLTIASAILGITYLGQYLKLGLDLKGGVQVRVQAQGDATKEEMDKVMSIMNMRINSLGVTEPSIQREGANRVLIELPGVQDPEEAIAMIGKTAYLTFGIFDEEGNVGIVLDGSHLVNAQEALQPASTQPGSMQFGDEYVVRLDFDNEGKQIFAETTQYLVDTYPNLSIYDASYSGDWRRNIAIFLDDDIISVPFVSVAIPTGEAVITGYKSLAEARQLALLLKSGALPVPVEIVEKRTIGPTLGADSIKKSQTAGLIGLALVIIFVLVVYRLPGVIAGFSLVLYSVLLLSVMALIRATLTLPGILGIVLSIGMCVDSNIIIYERLKDELRSGKTLRSAINSGFSRALWTIIDSNVTTLIAAAVLFWKGTGSIKGFAVTLSIGILISMFTAIVYTRFLLKNTAESGLFANLALYGVKGAGK